MTEDPRIGSLRELRAEFWRAVRDVVPEAFKDLGDLAEGQPMRELSKLNHPDVRFQAWYGECPPKIPLDPDSGESSEDFEARCSALDAQWNEFIEANKTKANAAKATRDKLKNAYTAALEAWAERWNLNSPWCLHLANKNLYAWLDANHRGLGHLFKSRKVHALTVVKSIPAIDKGIFELTDAALDRIRKELETSAAECGRDPELDRFFDRPDKVTDETRRDLEMFARYQAGGDSYQTIADNFGGSPRTAMKHIKAWADRLGLTLAIHQPGPKPSKN